MATSCASKVFWTTFILTHPTDIEHVLQTNAQNYHKGRSYRVMRESTGDGLFVSEGEFWRKQRRLAQPAFHRHRLAGFAQTMTRATEEMLASWDLRSGSGSEAFNIFAEMSALTLRIVGRTLFSTELAGETDAISRMLSVGQDFAIRRMWQTVKLPIGLPLPAHRRFQSAMREGDRIIYGMIDERRRRNTNEGLRDDLLEMLMEARDEATGEGMSNQQLRDEAFTIMVAGHETTALTLSWTWYLLAHHPHAERKLHTELASVLNGRTPTIEDLPNLKYTLMVIQETLRLYPPAWALGRTCD
ncbi:MAG: cytochrome P450 [Pyrinomonadaceae bacterium]